MLDQAENGCLRDQPLPPQKLLIDGAFVPASTGETLDVVPPLNGKVLTTIAVSSADDANRAVAAARAAFEDGRWRDMPPAMRKKIMLRWADLVDAEALQLAVMGVRDNGTEIGMARKAEPGSAAATIRY